MAVTLKGNNGTYEGTSEDNKPLDVPVNTEFNELDTGKTYYFDGETWNEEPPCEDSGFTPTAEQLAAMNSGVTPEDVAQIATNENNILLCKAFTDNATIDSNRKLYISATEPTGDIPSGSTWIDGNSIKVYDRTDNLLDYNTVQNDRFLSSETGLPSGYVGRIATVTPIDVEQLQNVTVSFTLNNCDYMYSIFDSNNVLIERVISKTSGDSIDVSTASYLYICLYITGDTITKNDVTDLMVNSGTTAEQFVPYLDWQ